MYEYQLWTLTIINHADRRLESGRRSSYRTQSREEIHSADRIRQHETLQPDTHPPSSVLTDTYGNFCKPLVVRGKCNLGILHPSSLPVSEKHSPSQRIRYVSDATCTTRASRALCDVRRVTCDVRRATCRRRHGCSRTCKGKRGVVCVCYGQEISV